MKKLKSIKYSRQLAYFSIKRNYESSKNIEKLSYSHLRNLFYFKVFIVNGKYESFVKKVKNLKIDDYEKYHKLIKHYIIYKILASFVEKNCTLSNSDFKILNNIKKYDSLSYNLINCFL